MHAGASVGPSHAGVCAEEVEHRLDEVGQVVVVLPAPVLPRVGVIKVHRPTVSWGRGGGQNREGGGGYDRVTCHVIINLSQLPTGNLLLVFATFPCGLANRIPGFHPGTQRHWNEPFANLLSYLNSLPSRLPTDGLSNGVHVVRDLQLGHVLLQLLRQLVGVEAHGVDVVRPHAERVGRRLHHLQRGAQAVVDVHHRQLRVGLQVALKLARLEGVVEDLDRVVWQRANGGVDGEGMGKVTGEC